MKLEGFSLPKLDKNNDYEISRQEIDGFNKIKFLDEVNKIISSFDKTKNKINNKNLLADELDNLNDILDSHILNHIDALISVLKLKHEFNTLYSNISKNGEVYEYDTSSEEIKTLQFIKSLVNDKKNLLDKIKNCKCEKYYLIKYLYTLKTYFSKEERYEIVIDIVNSSKESIFYVANNLKELKELELTNEQITKILKKDATKPNAEQYFENINLLRQSYKIDVGNDNILNLASEQVVEILKNAIKFVYDDVLIFYIEDMVNIGLSVDNIVSVIEGNLKNSSIFLNINNVKKSLKKDTTKFIKYFLKTNENIDDFVKTYKPIYLLDNEDDSKIILGKGFKNYEKYLSKKTYDKLLTIGLIDFSKKISSAINSIYDTTEYNNLEFNENKNIIKEIKNGFKKLSTEELLSSLGNHTINYAITFNLILEELDRRLRNETYFDYIDKNVENKKIKSFLKGQVIAGLSARGKIDLLLKNLKEKDFNIIEKIINYKQNNIFNFETYSGFLLGLKNIIEKDERIRDYIMHNKSIMKNLSFKKALEISFLLSKKKIDFTNGKISTLSDKDFQKYKDLLSKYSINVKEILKREKYDYIMLYSGNTEGGGLKYFKKDLEKFKKDGWKIKEKIYSYYILTKGKNRLILINYDEINNLNDIVTKLKLNPIMFILRGHNFKTKEIISEEKGIFKKFKNAVIFDGGCRNISLLNEYRQKDKIQNSFVGYNNTGKGNITYDFINNFITILSSSRENLSFPELKEKIIEKSKYKTYINKHIIVPGNLYDIVKDLEKNY